MTQTENGMIAVGAIAGILIALAIPEPAAMPPSPSNLSQESGRAFRSGNYWTVAPQRASTGAYGASVVVVDGDSLVVNGQKIRLAYIDAPESAQTCRQISTGLTWPCGEAATISLRSLVERDPAVRCLRVATDRHGRMVAICRNSAGVDLGALQVARGLAVAYHRYSSAYVDEEVAAKAEKLGIWAGTFTMPEQWRREQGR